MIVLRKNKTLLDDNGYRKVREKSLNDSGPGYSKKGYMKSFISSHKLTPEMEERLVNRIGRGISKMNEIWDDTWTF